MSVSRNFWGNGAPTIIADGGIRYVDRITKVEYTQQSYPTGTRWVITKQIADWSDYDFMQLDGIQSDIDDLQAQIDAEEVARIAGDLNLQTQINAITVTSGGYARNFLLMGG